MVTPSTSTCFLSSVQKSSTKEVGPEQIMSSTYAATRTLELVFHHSEGKFSIGTKHMVVVKMEDKWANQSSPASGWPYNAFCKRTAGRVYSWSHPGSQHSLGRITHVGVSLLSQACNRLSLHLLCKLSYLTTYHKIELLK